MLLQGCADRLADAEQIAKPAGLQYSEIPAPPFLLTVFARLHDNTGPLTFYIEGDGAAWKTSTEPSLDPTPRKALGLRLAALDPSPNLIYLARPCQFTLHDPACNETYWTNRRFSEEVVSGMNTAIDRLVAGRPGTKVNLVGYSGGGAIAALIAARRQDVVSLTTIAGNLDPPELAAYHAATPLTGSLNPLDISHQLAGLPQRHLVGTHDEIVPPFVATTFIQAQNDSGCATIIKIDAATHEEGWEKAWSNFAAHPPVCRTAK